MGWHSIDAMALLVAHDPLLVLERFWPMCCCRVVGFGTVTGKGLVFLVCLISSMSGCDSLNNFVRGLWVCDINPCFNIGLTITRDCFYLRMTAYDVLSLPSVLSRLGVLRNDTWLILPVVICLSQRLSHACVSMNKFRL